MIFRPELALKVANGEKTETRRVLSDNPRSPWFRDRCAYRKDQVFAVNPGRGIERIANARVEWQPYTARLDAIDDDRARREGFADRDDFLSAFEAINGDGITTVWVLRFKVCSVIPARVRDLENQLTGVPV